MKIAVLMSNNPASGWNMGHGIVNTLARLGHEALSVPMPTEREASEQFIAVFKRKAANLELLKTMDLIIVSGPEHISPWIDIAWSKYDWKHLDVPKAVWLHESCAREDFNIDYDVLKWCGDQWFFPAVQDAEFHDQEMFAAKRSHFLPFGVDTEVFHPGVADTPKVYPVGFLGLVYPKRQNFLEALSHHKHPGIRHGMAMIQDLRGYAWEDSMHLLAQNIRQIKVFINLPAMSRLLVAKVYEVMSCGTFLMTPEVPEGAQGNMEQFKHGEHLIYYTPSHVGHVAQLLRDWSSHEFDKRREEIAAAGWREVSQKHTLQIRIEEIFSKMKVGQRAIA